MTAPHDPDLPVMLVPAQWSGSVEHFYHFLFGYLYPAVLHVAEHGLRGVKVRDCGPMNPWFDACLGPLCEVEIVPSGVMLWAFATGEWPAVVLPADDDPDTFEPARLQAFSTMVRRALDVPEDTPAAGEVLMLSRAESNRFYAGAHAEIPTSGSERRSIPNLAAIASGVDGSRIFVPEHLDPAQQVRQVAGATGLVGQHGAGLAHAVWMPAGSLMVEIAPPSAGGPHVRIFESLAAALGMRYERVPQPAPHAPVNAGAVAVAVERAARRPAPAPSGGQGSDACVRAAPGSYRGVVEQRDEAVRALANATGSRSWRMTAPFRRIARIRARRPESTAPPPPITTPIDVVLAADAAFELPLAMALASLARSQPDHAALRISILTIDAGNGMRERLRAVAAPLALNFVEMDGFVPEHAPTLKHFSAATYCRLWAPALIPDPSAQMVYLDADILVLADLREMTTLDMGGYPVCAARSALLPYVSSTGALATWRELGLDERAPYFNTGVLLIDTPRWLAEDVGMRALQYVIEHGEVLGLPDQDAINAVLAARIAEMPLRWNPESSLRRGDHNLGGVVPQAEIANAVRNPAILHFTGPRKPWLPGSGDPGADAWLDLFATTMYAGPQR